MFLSAQLRRLTLCRLIGSQWRRDHRQPDCGRAPPENVAFEVRRGPFGWRKAADSPIGRRASSACRVTSGLEGSAGPSEAPHSPRNEHRERHPSGGTPTAPDGLNSSAVWGDAAGKSTPPGGSGGGQPTAGSTGVRPWARKALRGRRKRLRLRLTTRADLALPAVSCRSARRPWSVSTEWDSGASVGDCGAPGATANSSTRLLWPPIRGTDKQVVIGAAAKGCGGEAPPLNQLGSDHPGAVAP